MLNLEQINHLLNLLHWRPYAETNGVRMCVHESVIPPDSERGRIVAALRAERDLFTAYVPDDEELA